MAGLMEYFGLRPLEAGESRANPDGSSSTELSVHMPMQNGDWVQAPSLWMGPGGPVEITNEDELLRLLLQYEAGTGRNFPRWGSQEEALRDPGARSRQGGVSAGPMATYAPFRSPSPPPRGLMDFLSSQMPQSDTQ